MTTATKLLAAQARIKVLRYALEQMVASAAGMHCGLKCADDALATPDDTAELDALVKDAERLNHLESHCEWHIGIHDEEVGDIELQSVDGSCNDREYNTRGTGKTLRAAIDAAMKEPP
jgi:hypothetical protein